MAVESTIFFIAVNVRRGCSAWFKCRQCDLGW